MCVHDIPIQHCSSPSFLPWAFLPLARTIYWSASYSPLECFLLTVSYSPLPTHRFLLTVSYSPLPTHSFLLTASYSLFPKVTHSFLLTASYSPPPTALCGLSLFHSPEGYSEEPTAFHELEYAIDVLIDLHIP